MSVRNPENTVEARLRTIELDVGQSPELTRRVELVWQAHQMAKKSYRGRRYDGQIALFWSESDTRESDLLDAWRRMSTHELKIIEIPGLHSSRDSFFRDPNARVLAARLDNLLADARPHDGSEN